MTTTAYSNTGSGYVGGGSPQYVGTAVTDVVGFYGVTPVVQPSGASQAAVTLTATTALVTTAPTKTTTTYGFKTATQAAAITARVNQVITDLASLKTLDNALRSALVTLGLIKGAA